MEEFIFLINIYKIEMHIWTEQQKNCTIVEMQILPSFLLCGVFKTEMWKTMNNYTNLGLAQFKYHSEVLSWKEPILKSEGYTTEHDCQHFISTFQIMFISTAASFY